MAIILNDFNGNIKGKDILSIIIPVYKPGYNIIKILNAIANQDCNKKLDILVIDSGNGKKIPEELFLLNIRYIKISKKSFNHGLTRDFGASMALGDLLVFAVQDILPVNRFWLSKLIEPFEDTKVVGSYSMHIPYKNSDLIAKNKTQIWQNISKSKPVVKQSLKDSNLNNWQKRLKYNFDNVSSCIRKEVWKKYKFGNVEFGEDINWSFKVINKGYKIAFCKNSKVFHSHNTKVIGSFKRAFMDHKNLKRNLGIDFYKDNYNSSMKGFCFQSLSGILFNLTYAYKSNKSTSDKVKMTFIGILSGISEAAGTLAGIGIAKLYLSQNEDNKV